MFYSVFMCFSPYLEMGGGASLNGVVHKLLMQCFTLAAQNSKFAKLFFIL